MNSITPSRLAMGAAMASLALAAPAGAHSLAAGGLTSGLMHPLTGLDHLAMLLAVGGAAATISPRLLVWALGGALIGSVLGSSGLSLPMAELMAAFAVAVVALISLMASRWKRQPGSFQVASLAAPVVAVGIAIHAMLHGVEAPHEGAALLWWTGALSSSVLLCGGSFLLLHRLPSLRTAAAAALLLIGGCLTLATLFQPVLS